MTAYQTVRALEAAGITLREGTQNRIIATPRQALTDDLAAAIKQHRAAILDYLRTDHLGALTPPDTKGQRFEPWLTQQLMEQAAAYRRSLKGED